MSIRKQIITSLENIIPNEIIEKIILYAMYTPKNRDELDYALYVFMKRKKSFEFKKYSEINNWNTIYIKDMSNLFTKYRSFNYNINNWDVSNVENMENMFYGTRFNKDIDNWDVSNVKNFNKIFAYSNFCKDVSNWKINKNASTINVFLKAGVGY